MRILKLAFSKIYFPTKRYNSFFGNNSFGEFLESIVLILIPQFLLEKKVKEFEKKFGEYSHTQFNYTYALGRMALYQGLKASPFSTDDEILVPAFTCVVVPNAIIYAKLKPVYVDIENTHFNFDLADLEKKKSSKTKAIYLQYTFGHLGEVQKYYDFAIKNNLIIIEDCAHTLNQKVMLNGKITPIGTIGLFSFYSTDHSKIISTYLGGVLCTNSPVLAKKIEELNTHTPPMTSLIENRILLNGVLEFFHLNPFMFWIGEIGITILHRIKLIFHFNNELVVDFKEIDNYPMKMGPKLSFIGISQLKNLTKNLDHRLKLTTMLDKLVPLKDRSEIKPLLRYSFLVKDQQGFCQQLKKKFQLGIWFTSIFQGREDNFEELFYLAGSCPNAEYISKHIVNFPTHLAMDFDTVKEQLGKISFEVI